MLNRFLVFKGGNLERVFVIAHVPIDRYVVVVAQNVETLVQDLVIVVPVVRHELIIETQS